MKWISELFCKKTKIYGYAIECDYFGSLYPEENRSHWEKYPNYKIYKTKAIAEEAISYINSMKIKFRIVPIYIKK